MSAATVMCVERLSLASSSLGSLRGLLGERIGDVITQRRGRSILPFPTVRNIDAAANKLHVLQLADTRQDLVPGALEIVAFGDRHVQESFDSFHVLSFHLAQ